MNLSHSFSSSGSGRLGALHIKRGEGSPMVEGADEPEAERQGIIAAPPMAPTAACVKAVMLPDVLQGVR